MDKYIHNIQGMLFIVSRPSFIIIVEYLDNEYNNTSIQLKLSEYREIIRAPVERSHVLLSNVMHVHGFMEDAQMFKEKIVSV